MARIHRFYPLIILALASPAPAHDLWLLPPAQAKVGQPVLIKASVGMDFPQSELAHDTTRYVKRICLGPDGKERPLEPAGKEGKFGLLRFTPDAPGIYVLGVATQSRVLTLEAPAFNEYLVTDGLAHIFRLRSKEKILDQPGKERYSKSPRALILVGDGQGDPGRTLGLPLEIIPLADPIRAKVGGALRSKVLFQGQPLAGARVGWAHPGDGDEPRGTVRTDERGEALIPIVRPGLMTLRLTHMTRPKTADYEWESFWTSLTWWMGE